MSSRRLLLALPLALLACSQNSPAKQQPPPTGPFTTPGDGTSPPVPIALPASPADPPRTGKPPRSVGSGNGLTILAMHGLFRLDPPLAGEPLIDGLVQVELNGSTPPSDLTVALNGVALVPHDTGSGTLHSFWAIDPAGPQPLPDAAGYITVTAKTGSLVRSLPIPCPADIGVGTTSSSAGSIDLQWSPNLLVNDQNPFPSDYYASAHVRSLDVTTFTASENELAQKLLPKDTQRVSLDVSGVSASAYLAELRWQGPFVSDGDSRAFCGRAKRLAYAR